MILASKNKIIMTAIAIRLFFSFKAKLIGSSDIKFLFARIQRLDIQYANAIAIIQRNSGDLY